MFTICCVILFVYLFKIHNHIHFDRITLLQHNRIRWKLVDIF